MRVWIAWAFAAAAYLAVIAVDVGREARRTVPTYAGRLCDQVWQETRKAEPTVGWYRACIKEVAALAALKEDETK